MTGGVSRDRATRVVVYAPGLTLTSFHRQSPWMMIPRSLQEMGCEVTLVCGRFLDTVRPLYRVIETKSATSTRVSLRVARSSIDPLLALPSIKRENPDVVIVGPLGPYLPTLLFLVRARLFQSGPRRSPSPIFVLKVDINLLDKSRRGLLGWATNTLVVLSSRVLDWVTLESSCSVRFATALPRVRAERVIHMPLGFPQGLITIRPYAGAARGPVVLCVGRVEPGKGQKLLLEAFANLAPEFPDWSLKYIGPIEDQSYLRSMQEVLHQNKLEERVSFLGFMEPGPRLDAEYSKAAVFCLPSFAESAGQVKYEAIASGLPLVTTGFPCREDTEAMGCVVVETGSVPDLVTALRSLMSSPEERRRRSELSQSRIRSYVEITSELLNRVLGNRDASSAGPSV